MFAVLATHEGILLDILKIEVQVHQRLLVFALMVQLLSVSESTRVIALILQLCLGMKIGESSYCISLVFSAYEA
jgi:hypothetical protein